MRFPKKPLIFTILAISAAAFFGVRHFTPPPSEPKPIAVTPAPDAPIIAPDDEVHAKYAGSESCKKCHAGEFEKWHPSNHGRAERMVSKDEDYKSFEPKQTLTHGKDTSEAFVDADGLAKILTTGLDKKHHAHPVVRVIGNEPLRQFLIPAPGGRMQTCDVTLDPAKNEWFDVFGDEDERAPGDWGHWTGQGMNWNAMCAACHNTRLRKNYEPQTNSYHTTMAEMSVGCESCHGPMKDHVEWQENPPPEAEKRPHPSQVQPRPGHGNLRRLPRPPRGTHRRPRPRRVVFRPLQPRRHRRDRHLSPRRPGSRRKLRVHLLPLQPHASCRRPLRGLPRSALHQEHRQGQPALHELPHRAATRFPHRSRHRSHRPQPPRRGQHRQPVHFLPHAGHHLHAARPAPRPQLQHSRSQADQGIRRPQRLQPMPH